MIEVIEMRVRTFDLDTLTLFWRVAPLPFGDGDKHEVFDYAFYVLRSGDSPMGPYEQIGGPLTDRYEFRDVTVSLLHKWRQYHYKLKVIHLPSGEEKFFGPTSSEEPEPDLIAAEVIRNEDMLFREFIGRKCWLFPRRTFGPLCSCYDIVLGRTTRSGHAPCFGTGFLGGYMAPILVYAQVDANPKNFRATAVGEIQPNDTTGRMTAFPPVSPRDILVESENIRWRVEKVTPTERLRATLRQELTLHGIPKGDIEYELPVKVSLKDLQPAAPRNFTNPTNLEADDDYSDIISAWGHPRGVL